MSNSKKLHRAWLVLAGMILMQGGTMGVLINCTGVFFSAIISDLGFRAGDLSIYYTIRSLVSAFAVGTTTKLFFRWGGRRVMAVLGTVLAVSFGCMSLFDQLWQWYFSAVFGGVGMSCVMVVVPVVLNNWFKEHNGLIIGLGMSASGVAGALFSPICSWLISWLGWRLAVAVLACISWVIVVPASLLLIDNTPESVGCTPLGYEKASGASQTRAVSVAVPPSWVFPACAFALIGAGSLNQFNNQLPIFAQSVGYPLAVGAMLTSLAMVGNVLGKLSIGALSDRIGPYRAVQSVLMTVGSVMLVFLLCKQSTAALYTGSLFFGAVYALTTTMPGLLLIDLYGSENYRSRVSRSQAVSGFVSAITSSVIPYLYDITGSFDIVFVFGAGLCAAGIGVVCLLERYAKKRVPLAS